MTEILPGELRSRGTFCWITEAHVPEGDPFSTLLRPCPAPYTVWRERDAVFVVSQIIGEKVFVEVAGIENALAEPVGRFQERVREGSFVYLGHTPAALGVE